MPCILIANFLSSMSALLKQQSCRRSPTAFAFVPHTYRFLGRHRAGVETGKGHKIDGDELLACIMGKRKITEDLRAV